MTPMLLVVGSVNYDLIWSHERLPVAGESVVGAELFESPGGKGANQAIAAARSSRDLGDLRVVFGGAIGNDHFGQLQRANLERDGIDTGGLVVIDETRTGTSSVWVDSATGENRILSAPGANAHFGVECLTPLPVEDADLILVPNEIPEPTIEALALRAAQAGVPLIWNPAPFPSGSTRAVAPGLARLVTPNQVEAAALFGERPGGSGSEDEIWAVVEALQQQGDSGVVITLGEHGAVAAEGGERWSVPAPAVRAVDTTGAGDAFNGSLAAALAGGAELGKALELAVAYASASVRRPGTQTSYPYGVPTH